MIDYYSYSVFVSELKLYYKRAHVLHLFVFFCRENRRLK